MPQWCLCLWITSHVIIIKSYKSCITCTLHQFQYIWNKFQFASAGGTQILKYHTSSHNTITHNSSEDAQLVSIGLGTKPGYSYMDVSHPSDPHTDPWWFYSDASIIYHMYGTNLKFSGYQDHVIPSTTDTFRLPHGCTTHMNNNNQIHCVSNHSNNSDVTSTCNCPRSTR